MNISAETKTAAAELAAAMQAVETTGDAYKAAQDAPSNGDIFAWNVAINSDQQAAIEATAAANLEAHARAALALANLVATLTDQDIEDLRAFAGIDAGSIW
jgi:hypothetical protein